MIGCRTEFLDLHVCRLGGSKAFGLSEDTKMLVIVVAVSILIYFGIRRFLSKDRVQGGVSLKSRFEET